MTTTSSDTAPLKLVDATQSSTGWGGTAERAIDGNTDGNYWRK